jgi:hypothetical protein
MITEVNKRPGIAIEKKTGPWNLCQHYNYTLQYYVCNFSLQKNISPVCSFPDIRPFFKDLLQTGGSFLHSYGGYFSLFEAYLLYKTFDNWLYCHLQVVGCRTDNVIFSIFNISISDNGGLHGRDSDWLRAVRSRCWGSSPGRGKIILSSKSSRPVLGPIQCVTGFFPPG